MVPWHGSHMRPGMPHYNTLPSHLHWHFNMEDSYTVSMSLNPNVVLNKSMSPKSDDKWKKMLGIPYLAGIGSLMYASMATWPDITYTMDKLSQFNADPGLPHWTTLQWVFHYFTALLVLASHCDNSPSPQWGGVLKIMWYPFVHIHSHMSTNCIPVDDTLIVSLPLTIIIYKCR